MGRNLGEGLERAVQIYGARQACVSDEVDFTWAEVGERVVRLAGALRKAGVNSGDQVALAALNSHRYLEVLYAVTRIGARVVPLNYRLAPPEIIYCLNDSETQLLIVDDTFATLAEEGRGAMETVREVIRMGDDYEARIEAAEPVERVEVDEDEIAGLFYTGGTTGNPKGVMLTHRNLCDNALHIIAAMGYADSDRYLHVAPMFHLADGASTFAVTWCGGTHAFVPMFRPDAVGTAVERFGVTVTLMVPTMFTMLMADPGFDPSMFASLRRVIYGASPMPQEVLSKVLATLPCEVAQGYGMTETAPLLTVLAAEDHARGVAPSATDDETARLASAGRAIVGVDVRVVDGDDCQVAAGEVGEIVARGPNVMKGYWKLPEATADALRGGWMHTGDLARIDGDGYIYIVDRAKDMIISGGENVFSVEVENALYAHPSVLEVAVIGVPDEKWGERVHAVVVLKPDTSASGDDLATHCHELIAGYKVPRSFEFKDELPKSGAGKIVKRDLREPHWANESRQVH